ncbi:class I SAM-dependent methyltransferase [Bacillus cereus]|jgi:Methyltransferase domain|uniref:Class I SAM-dependent methyltransferase n=1 Tax=Bacillus cereus TaxID=1396 RepID=A0A2B1KZQ4_BACCE|nr:class I SAM-dependent methyltransferase [Bacillus cereus]PFN28988.1 hypothetical protein COJ50_03195 [Bacillus cereus]
MRWIYYDPIFEVDQVVPSVRTSSPWAGHNKFAYDLVTFFKPKKIVELGTFFGSSFYSFCQAVKDEQLSTQCTAIDTWQGDPHGGYYGEHVFETVTHVLNTCYPGIGTTIRSTFDDALDQFEDESIDLLHIDGFHTFEAVSHDYATWLPKLKKNGIILFHDISVFENGFGVHVLWNSLKAQYPHLEFTHSYGLGVLFPKGYEEQFENVLKNNTELQLKYGG